MRIVLFSVISMLAAAASAQTSQGAIGQLAVPVQPQAAPVAAPANDPQVAKKPITVTGNKDVKAPWNGEKIVCTRVAPVGSLIPVRHCTTKSEDKANRAAVDEIATKPIENVFSN